MFTYIYNPTFHFLKAHNNLKLQAQATNDPAGQVVGQVVGNLPEEVAATMTTQRNMVKTVHRARAADGDHRPVPNVRHGWDFPVESEFLEDGSRFCQYDSAWDNPDDPNRFIIMTSDRALERMGNAEHFFSDGTFSEVPLFEQLYTIHIDYVRYSSCSSLLLLESLIIL